MSNITSGIILDCTSLFGELNTSLDNLITDLAPGTGKYSDIMTGKSNDLELDSELKSDLSSITFKVQRLVYALVDYKVRGLVYIKPQAVTYINSVRKGERMLAISEIESLDKCALLVYRVIEKLDTIDTNNQLGNTLLLALDLANYTRTRH